MNKKIMMASTIILILIILTIIGIILFQEPKIAILGYHAFATTEAKQNELKDDNLSMDIGYFEKQLQYLQKHHYKTLTLEEVYRYLQGNEKIPCNSVLITMDDGYMSNYELAFPLLKKYQMNAVVFVIGQNVEAGYEGYMDLETIKKAQTQYPNITFASHSYGLHEQGAIDRGVEYIKEDFKNYIMQSGLQESILEDLYDREKVNTDIDMVIDSIFENKKLNIDTKTITKKLDNRINAVLESNNRKPDAIEKEEIKIFEDTISQVYNDGIVYSSESILEIANIYNKIQPLIIKIINLLGVLIMALLVIIFVINRNLKQNINAVGIALFSSGLLDIIVKVLVGDKAHNILILNTTFSESVIYLINSIISIIFVTGIVMSIIGFVLIIISNIEKRNM